jgi:hypothetical protein
LWLLPLPLVIWAAHFLLSYVTAAIICAKSGSSAGAVAQAQAAIAVYTLFALSAIAVSGWRGWKWHATGDATLPHDADTPEDRTRFLGFASFLMAALSAVAVIFVALAVALVGTCR